MSKCVRLCPLRHANIRPRHNKPFEAFQLITPSVITMGDDESLNPDAKLKCILSGLTYLVVVA